MTRKHPLAKCENCPLYKERIAPTSGPEDAEIAFVSRSPGKYDVDAGKPFAGPSGRVLDHLLNMYDVQRKDILTTNVVLCYSDEPPQEAIDACHDRLVDDIKGCKTVLAGGVEAVHELINPRSSVTSARGKEHVRNGQRRIATSNPAVVLRDSTNFPDLVKDFRLALSPIPPPTLPTVEIIERVDEAIGYFEYLRGSLAEKTIASDLETQGYYGKIACAGFSESASRAVVVSWEALDHPEVYEAMKNAYEDDKIKWVWHNGKYDVKVLRKLGIKARIDEDSFCLSYALDERPGGDYQGDQGAGLHALTPVLMEDYGWPDYEPNSVKEFKKTGVLAEPEELYRYCGFDTAGTRFLLDDLAQKARSESVYNKPYRSVFIPLANSLVPVELRGFCFDEEAAADLNEEHVLPRLRYLTNEMRRISGRELLNPRSNKQLKGILYEQYALRHNLRDTRKKIKSGSVDADVRREILEGRFKCKSGKSEELVSFVHNLDIFNKIDKQRGTYIEGLIKKVADDGKLYSTFKFGTETGRTSSENPNFQNVTRSGAHGIPSIRTLFKPSPGCSIVSADYSQAELRSIAKLSRSEGLLSIYRDTSRSLHRERATQFYGKDYTKEEYVKAKNMNFGVCYLQSAMMFSQLYTIPEDEAQEYIDEWFREFPEILKWHEKVWQEARTGAVTSPFGHKRRFYLITKENKDEAKRQAINFLPQNIAGVLTELALIELVNLGVPIVTTVHDSIVADVPSNDVFTVARTMQMVMEEQAIKHLGWTPDDIPFKVDISISSESWADVKEVELAEAA